MKFKALFAGVLIGAIALSSCVKNVESPEVTALRNARADEMRAAAEYSRALAAGETTRAAAEAAYYNAQAAYQNALAEYQKARTEQEKAQAKIDMAYAEQQVAYYAAQMKLDEIRNQITLLQQQQLLNTELKNMNSQQAAYIAKLTSDYTTYLSQLSAAYQNYATQEKNLANLMAHTVDPNDVLRQNIADEEVWIEKYQAELDALEAYLGEDVETLAAKRDELLVALNEAIRVQTDKGKAVQSYSYPYGSLYTAYDNQKTYLASGDVLYPGIFDNNTNFGNGGGVTSADFIDGFIHTYAPYTKKGIYGGTIKYQYNEEAKKDFIWLNEAYYEVEPTTGTDPEKVILWREGQQDAWLWSDERHYPEAVDGVYPSGYLTWYTEVYIPGKVNAGNVEKIYTAAKDSIQVNIDAATGAVKEAEEAKLEALEEHWTAVKEQLEELATTFVGYEDQIEIFDQAFAAYRQGLIEEWDANKAYEDAYAAWDAVNKVLTAQYYNQGSGYYTIESRIENLKTWIKTSEDIITGWEAQIATNDTTHENAIESTKALMAQYKEQIEALEKTVAILKKQLEDALKELNNGAAA